ncbi:IS1-like element transposase [Spirosoma horti]
MTTGKLPNLGFLPALKPKGRPGFVQTYTQKAGDPLVKEQITQMVLNGAGIRDTAASAVRPYLRC